MKVTFAGYECNVLFERYQVVDQIAILLREVGTGMPIATATVCIPEWEPYRKPDAVAIKDYSENEGLFDALYDAGVVRGYAETEEQMEDDRDMVHLWPVGHTAATICRLTEKAYTEYCS